MARVRGAPAEPTAPRRLNTVRMDLSGASDPHTVEVNDVLLPDIRSTRIETTAAGEVLVTLTFQAAVINAPIGAVPAAEPIPAAGQVSTSVDTDTGCCAGCGRDLAELSLMEANYVPLAVSKYGVPLCAACFKEKKTHE